MTGDDIIALRERTHLTQEALARILKISTTTVHRWETSPKASVRATGGAASFLQALDHASKRDPSIVRHIYDWPNRGEFYFWSKIFYLSYEHVTKKGR